MDYKARFYSPYLNRFLQPDSIIPNPANPQSLNRFGYVGNNPIRYNDPTGHIMCEFDAQGNDYCYENDRKTTIRKEPKGNQPPILPLTNSCNRPNRSVVCLPPPDQEPEPKLPTFPPMVEIPVQPTIDPLIPEYDFIAPWEFDRLDALGIRINGTYCFIIICGDISIDLIGNSYSNEATLFVTPGIGGGLGYGFDVSGGIIAAYDAPTNSSLAGAARNFTLNFTPEVGGQVAYSVAADPNFTGNYAQTYNLGITGGAEASAYYSASYSIPIGTCDLRSCYSGVK